MNGWAVAYLVINALGLGLVLANHGKETKTNFWATFIVWLFVILPILYMAGTFSP